MNKCFACGREDESFTGAEFMAEVVKDMREFVRAVAHIGVDFGYGPYELEQKHIDKARELVAQSKANGEVTGA